MALDLDKLKSGITDAMLVTKEDNLPDSDLASMMAQAIVDYASDAEVMLPAPVSGFVQTVTPFSPDASLAGKKLAVATADVGKSALEAAILGSLKAMDVAFGIMTTGIVTYAATFLAFESTPVTAAGATVMSVPPIFVPALAIGMAGGSTEDVGASMATIIHASFTTSVFTGAGANPGFPSAGPVIGTLL